MCRSSCPARPCRPSSCTRRAPRHGCRRDRWPAPGRCAAPRRGRRRPARSSRAPTSRCRAGTRTSTPRSRRSRMRPNRSWSAPAGRSRSSCRARPCRLSSCRTPARPLGFRPDPSPARRRCAGRPRAPRACDRWRTAPMRLRRAGTRSRRPRPRRSQTPATVVARIRRAAVDRRVGSDRVHRPAVGGRLLPRRFRPGPSPARRRCATHPLGRRSSDRSSKASTPPYPACTRRWPPRPR